VPGSAVYDANVLIDLEMADLLDPWLEISGEAHTTDFVASELNRGGHQRASARIKSGRITCEQFSPEELSSIQSLREGTKPAISLADASVLWLARKWRCRLLTGDDALRKIARKQGVEVHGTLWIFVGLVQSDRLSREQAGIRLRRLLATDRRLPRDECDRLLLLWTKQPD